MNLYNKYMMKEYVIYLIPEKHIKTQKEYWKINELCQFYCADAAVMDKLDQLVWYPEQWYDQYVLISILELLEWIEKSLLLDDANIKYEWKIIGEDNILIEKVQEKEKKFQLLKIIGTAIIVFIGSAFSIMTYDQDVNMEGIFERLYIFFGNETIAHTAIMEKMYAIGLALGLLLFLRPWRSTYHKNVPSPVDMEMRKYEEDRADTIIKIKSRCRGKD